MFIDNIILGSAKYGQNDSLGGGPSNYEGYGSLTDNAIKSTTNNEEEKYINGNNNTNDGTKLTKEQQINMNIMVTQQNQQQRRAKTSIDYQVKSGEISKKDAQNELKKSIYNNCTSIG